jgi:glycosyltransferase involved in cell wall biosynthesis
MVNHNHPPLPELGKVKAWRASRLPNLSNLCHAEQMSSDQPSVSVVLVTYNRASLLNATIDSVLGQTMVDFELIIADDASPDGTQQVCQRRAISDNRIRYQRRPENMGMPQNLNLGILASTGKYVAILHDDDVYCSDLLREWKTCLDEHPKAAFVFNAYRVLDAQGRTRTVYRETLPRCSPGSILLESILFRRWRFDSPVWGTVMMRRSAFDRAGPFDERYGYWADVDMWMRLAEDFEVCYIDEPLIAVTSRDVAPHQFDDSVGHVQPLVRRMFWEARMRHYHRRPARRLAEAIRHWSFVAASRAWHFACAVKGRVRPLRRSDSICL